MALGFRNLTPEEVEFVAGGNPYSYRDSNGHGGGSYGNLYGYSFYYGSGGYSTSGNAGGNDPSYSPPPANHCELDEAQDTIAQGIEAAIKAKADWNEREYGALILRDSSGYIYMGALVKGETVAEAAARASASGDNAYAPQTNYGSVPAGYTVVGAVHNHPDIGYNDAQDEENHYPSLYSGGTGGDYTTFDNLVGKDSRFSSGADFVQYILGPDGVLREFDFNAGHITASNDPSPISRQILDADRTC